MATQLRFDVTALDQASRTFARMAQAVERFERRLDKLDGKNVDVEVDVDTKNAEREIGAFATNARRRIDQALSSIPDVQIDGDSSDLDRELADVRSELASLRDTTVGVDLDAEEFNRRVDAARERLQRLANESPSVQVRADAADALAKLALVNTEADRIDGRTATVKVKTDKSLSDATIDIALLGRSLTALAIPAGVIAGAPAIASLGDSAKVASQSMLLIPAAASAAGLAVATLKVGFQGFADAVGDDPKKAAEALSKMAPAAREAASAVQSLRPAWDGLRLEVQGKLFDGLGQQIRQLGGTYVPILKDAMSGVAQSFNGAAKGVGDFLARSQTVDTVRTMFGDLRQTIANLAPAVAPLVSVFTDLSATGATVLRDLTAGAGRAAQGFATFIAQARQSGQLAVWMREGVDVLRQLGQVAVNSGSILNSIFTAAGSSGTSFLTTLVNITGRMREFLASAQGQSALVNTFESIRSVVAALLPGIQAVGRALAEIVVSREASGALEALASAFSSLVEAAAPVVVLVSGMVSRAITPLASALGFLAPVIGPVVGGLIAMKAASSALSFVAAISGLKALTAAATGAVGSLNTLRAGATNAATGTAAATSSAQNAGAAMRAAASGAAAAGGGLAVVGDRAKDTGGKVDGLRGKFESARAGAGSLAAGLPLVATGFTLLVAGAQAGKSSLTEMDAAVAAGGPALDAFRQKLIEQGDGLQDSTNWLGQATHAVDEWLSENISGIPTLTQLNRKIEEQNQRLNEQASAAGVSRASFDAMRASTEASDAATGKFNDNLRLITPALAGMKDGISPTREMSLALQGLGTDANAAAIASGEAAQRLGGVDAGAKAASASMAASRDSFIQAAVSAGMTEDAAARLADQLGLIPSKVETEFRSNAATVNLDIAQIADNLRDVPAGKSITVTSITADARRQLEDLGFKVRDLPNGKVEVTATTDAAKRELDLLASAARRPENKNINLLTLDAHTKARVLADEASRPENKQVNLDIMAAQANAQLLSQAASRPENKHLDLNTLDAHTKARILAEEATRPVIKPVDGNTAGFTGKLQVAVGAAASTNAVVPIDGNPGLFRGQVLNGVQFANGSTGTMTIDGNPQVAFGKTRAAVTFADGSTGRITIDGNQTPANGKVQASVTYANGSKGTITVDARDLATPAINRIPKSGTTVWTIQYVTVGAAPGPMSGSAQARAAGGYARPRARGGYAQPVAYASGGLRPMSAARAEIVPARQPRIIGDRMLGDEAFIPVNRSLRSLSILARTNAAMGQANISQADLDALLKRTSVGSLTARMNLGTDPAALLSTVRAAQAASTTAMVAAGMRQAAAIAGLRGGLERIRGEMRAVAGAVREAREIHQHFEGDDYAAAARETQLLLRLG